MKQNATAAGDIGTETGVPGGSCSAERPARSTPTTRRGLLLQLGRRRPAPDGDPTRYPGATPSWPRPTTAPATKCATSISGCANPNQAIERRRPELRGRRPNGRRASTRRHLRPLPRSAGTSISAIHFRISSRHPGPKNTVSYTQVMVQWHRPWSRDMNHGTGAVVRSIARRPRARALAGARWPAPPRWPLDRHLRPAARPAPTPPRSSPTSCCSWIPPGPSAGGTCPTRSRTSPTRRSGSPDDRLQELRSATSLYYNPARRMRCRKPVGRHCFTTPSFRAARYNAFDTASATLVDLSARSRPMTTALGHEGCCTTGYNDTPQPAYYCVHTGGTGGPDHRLRRSRPAPTADNGLPGAAGPVVAPATAARGRASS